MIDPSKITKFDRTDHELQEFLMFCIMVAGKSATQTAQKLEDFLQCWQSPFAMLTFMIKFSAEGLIYWMKEFKLGQYNRLQSAFTGILSLDLRTCTVADLEAINGIGPKTARFFIVHSRPDQNHAILDTHILAYMRSKGIETPKTTPSGKKYLELEQKFLALVPEGMTVADFDLQIWNERTKAYA